MATVVEVANIALITLGAQTINALSETTTEAVAVNANWNTSRRALLATTPWNFAIARAVLAQESSATPAFRYKYQYPVPADLITLIKVNNDPDYKLEGGKILTDRITCEIKYTSDVTDTARWDATFTDTMASRLALDLAYTLPRARTMIDTQLQLFSIKLQQAQYHNAAQDIPDELGQFDDTLVSSRFYSGSY